MMLRFSFFLMRKIIDRRMAGNPAHQKRCGHLVTDTISSCVLDRKHRPYFLTLP